MAKLDRQQKTTANLPLKPLKDKDGGFLYDGFVPAFMTKLEVIERKYEKGEFEGFDVPILQFTFSNFPLNPDEPERVLIHEEKPVGTIEYKGENKVTREEKAIEDNITEMWKRIKSVLDEMSDSPNFRAVADISDANYEKYFDIPTFGKVEDRIKAFRGFFTFLAEFVNGKGNQKSMLTHPKFEGKCPMWLNIQAEYKNKKYFVIPTFVSTGIVEKLRVNDKGKPISPKRLERKPSDQLILVAGGAPKAVIDASIPGAGGSQAVVDDLDLD